MIHNQHQITPELDAKLQGRFLPCLVREARFHAIVLEDDPTYLRILERFAEKRNIQITSCQTFGEFKKKWKSSSPDVALIDFNLGGDLNGSEVARLLGKTPVVLMSRSRPIVQRNKSWSDNIKVFLDKSVGVSELLDAAAEFAYEKGVLDRYL